LSARLHGRHPAGADLEVDRSGADAEPADDEGANAA
jgi:hypothetical protein